MERNVFFGESDPGPYAKIIDAFVQTGLQAIPPEPKLQSTLGKLDGLVECYRMRNAGLVDFELAVMVCSRLNKQNHIRFTGGEMPIEDAVYENSLSVPIIECYETLKVAAYFAINGKISGEEQVPDIPPPAPYLLERYEELTSKLNQE